MGGLADCHDILSSADILSLVHTGDYGDYSRRKRRQCVAVFGDNLSPF